MIYQHPRAISKKEAEELFNHSESEIICDTLVSIAFYESDWKWVQDKCLFYLNNDDSTIRGLAATCLGHVARIHGKLEKDNVILALTKHINEEYVGGRVIDALEDIRMALG